MGDLELPAQSQRTSLNPPALAPQSQTLVERIQPLVSAPYAWLHPFLGLDRPEMWASWQHLGVIVALSNGAEMRR